MTIIDGGDSKNVYYNVNVSTPYINEQGMITADGDSGYFIYNSSYLQGDITSGTVSDAGTFDDWSLKYPEGATTYLQPLQALNSKNVAGVKLGSLSSYDDLKLSQQEIYDLYTYYVKEVYKKPVICEGGENYEAYTSAPKINWMDGKECHVDVDKQTGQPNEPVYGVDGKGHFTAEINSVDDVILALEGIDLSQVNTTDPGTVDSTAADSEVDGGSDDESDPCYDNSGSLGWIMCPLIMKLSDTLSSIYDGMVEPFLEVEPSLLASGSGTRQAWTIFRDIANTLFVVLLIVVIFSQLTGVGIDNYGIKKIMPKLIISAILINLSYLICQLAVDVSNILGSGLNVMLSGLAKHIGVSIEESFSSGAWFKTMLNALVGVLTVGGGVGLVHTVVTGGIAGIIMPLLIGLFIAFVAVIFFFALLGLRKAGVIILVAVAPIAIVCYMLPNTKRIFDRWLSIFKGLLLVHPICGLTIGGGVLASRMLTSESDDFFVYMIGLLIAVVPFFLVPFLVRSAFNAVGNIGTKITRFGNRFGRGTATRADAGVRKSDTYRRADNWLGRHNAFSARRRAVAVEGTTALARERAMRARLGDRGNMQTRIAATVAAEDRPVRAGVRCRREKQAGP